MGFGFGITQPAPDATAGIIPTATTTTSEQLTRPEQHPLRPPVATHESNHQTKQTDTPSSEQTCTHPAANYGLAGNLVSSATIQQRSFGWS